MTYNNNNNYPNNNNGFNNNNQGGGQGTGQRSLNSHVSMQLVANIVNDPQTKPVGNQGAKVAYADVAINHTQDKPADFWRIEVWVNQGQTSGYHDFLLEYCKKGRQVFIEGTPQLKKTKRQNNGQDVMDSNGKAIYDSFPTIRVSKLMGLGSPSNNNQDQGNNNQQQQQGGFQQQPQGGFQPQQQQQGGFQQQPQGNLGAPQGQPGGFTPQPQQAGFAPQGQPGGFQPQGQPGGFQPAPPSGQFQCAGR